MSGPGIQTLACFLSISWWDLQIGQEQNRKEDPSKLSYGKRAVPTSDCSWLLTGEIYKVQ